MKQPAEIQDPLAPLADEFIQCCRSDGKPSVEEFAQRYPEQADRIRSLFPALMLVEALSPIESPGRPELPIESRTIGERIGDYRIEGELGRGGMGIVYRAVHMSLGREVALKILTGPAADRSHRALERFQLEARWAARLHHPHIVPVFDVGNHGDTWYYTMQLIHGKGLDQVLSEMPIANSSILRRGGDQTTKGRASTHHFPVPDSSPNDAPASDIVAEVFPSNDALDEDRNSPPLLETRSGSGSNSRYYYRDAAEIARQVADALEFAHKHSILHRDIKPSNLLVDNSGNIWVTDFGLAKAFEISAHQAKDLTGTGDIVGTLRYMAPERLRGWSDPRSDVYSLGMTLYELLTRKPAFQDNDRIRLIEKIRAEAPVKPRTIDSQIPVDLETIVLKSIDKEPGRRYQSAGELAEDLANYLADRSIRARRDTLVATARRWCRRNPVIATLSILLVLVGVLAWSGTLFLWQRAENMHRQSQTNLADANRNLNLAVSAVDEFYSLVADDPRLKQYDLRPLRSDLLKTAIDFQRQLLELRPDTQVARIDLARAWQRLGFLTSEIDDADRAVAFSRNAIECFDEVVRENPHNVLLQLELAACLNQFARALSDSGHSEQAIAPLNRSAFVLQEMLRINPDSLAANAELANTWALHAHAMSWNMQLEEAIALERKSVGQRQILATLNPENTSCLSEWANARFRLAKLLLAEKLSNWREAESELTAALKIQREAENHSDATLFEHRVLGAILRSLGEVCKISGRPELANTYLIEASEVFNQLCQDEPSVLTHAIDLGSVWFEIACCASIAEDSTRVRRAFEKSISILEPVVEKAPDNVVSATLLARNYYRLGNEIYTQDPDGALKNFDRGVAICNEILIREPVNRNAVVVLPGLLASRAKLHAGFERYTKALVDCQRAIDVASGADRGSILLDCALVMTSIGQYQRAADQAQAGLDDLAAHCDPHFMTDSWRQGAVVLARAAQLAGTDPDLDPGELEAECSSYCDRAIAMLEQGVKAGLSVESLTDDPEFTNLRRIPEFQLLVEHARNR